jgi:hypothetical protein
MKSILLLVFFLPLCSLVAQDTIHVPELNTSHYYRRMVCSDSNTVTLLSIDFEGQSAFGFHNFNLHDGSLKSVVHPVVPSFDLKYSVSKLPNIEVGAISYPNFLFVGERNDSVFLISTKFTQDLDFVEILDLDYLPFEAPNTSYGESTQAIPVNDKLYFFISSFQPNDPNSGSHALVKVSPNHQVEATMMDSAESNKLRILHYLKDMAFLDEYYYVTGYNSSLSAIIDTNLNVVNKGNTNYFDPFNSDNDYSLRGYVVRQVTNDRMAVIGDGYYGNFPPLVKPTIQTVKVENAEIVFEDHDTYATSDRGTEGVEATYPTPSHPAIFLAGAEPETPFDFTKSYIYVKKLVEGEEVLYKRYGNDYYYEVKGIDFMENGNIVICGFTVNYHTAEGFEGFFMFLDQEGDAVLSTNSIFRPTEKLDVFPVPASDKLFFKTDLVHDAYFEITDLIGNIVFTERNAKTDYIDVSGLSSGFYFLRVYEKSKIYASKFVKIHK